MNSLSTWCKSELFIVSITWILILHVARYSPHHAETLTESVICIPWHWKLTGSWLAASFFQSESQFIFYTKQLMIKSTRQWNELSQIFRLLLDRGRVWMKWLAKVFEKTSCSNQQKTSIFSSSSQTKKPWHSYSAPQAHFLRWNNLFTNNY